MIKLASLFLELGAKGDKLTAELKKTERQTQGWSKSVDKAVKAVSVGFAAAASSAAILGAAIAANYEIDSKYIDNLAKMAAKIGETTEGMTNLRLAAQYGGVEINTMDMAMQRMVRRLAEAAQGTGEAKGAIEELGLDAANLARARPEQAFAAIAAELEQIPNASDRVRLAMKFFDSEGVALVNVFNKTLNQATADIEAMGGALTEFDTTAVERASDEMTRLGAAIDLARQRFSAGLAPAVSTVASALFDVATEASGVGRNLDNVGRVAIGVASVVGDSFNLLKIPFQGVAATVFSLELGIRQLLDTLGVSDQSVQIAVIEQQIDDLVAKINNAIEMEFGTELLARYTREIEEISAAASRIGSDRVDTAPSQPTSTEPDFQPGVYAGGPDRARIKSQNEAAALAAEEYRAAERENLIRHYQTIQSLEVRADEERRIKAKRAADLDIQLTRRYHLNKAEQAQAFQDTWTFYQEQGTAGRLAILAIETQGSLAILAQHSRAAFELHRAVSLGQAAISIATGIARALELPFPANLKAGAKVALEGAAQVAQINAAKYGTGGVTAPGSGSTASSGAVASGALPVPAQPVQSQDNDDDTRTINWHIYGDARTSDAEFEQRYLRAREQARRSGRIKTGDRHRQIRHRDSVPA